MAFCQHLLRPRQRATGASNGRPPFSASTWPVGSPRQDTPIPDLAWRKAGSPPYCLGPSRRLPERDRRGLHRSAHPTALAAPRRRIAHPTLTAAGSRFPYRIYRVGGEPNARRAAHIDLRRQGAVFHMSGRRASEPGALPAPATEEQRVLRAIRAPSNVRLACQLRPRGPVSVVPLLLSSKVSHGRFRRPVYAEGREQEIVVLFADCATLRGSRRRGFPMTWCSS